MNDWLIGGIILAVIVVIVFGWGTVRAMLKGFGGVFVQNVAQTPEGAAAIFDANIQEKQGKYRTAHDTLQRVSGQLDSARNDLERNKKELENVESKAHALARVGQYDKVQLYAAQRNAIQAEMESLTATIAKLEPIMADATMICNTLENDITTLQKEKNRTINELKTNKELKATYDSMDKLKGSSETDRLLERVRTGAREASEAAVGARTVHENMVSTQLQHADDEARKLQSDAWVESLKQQYNGVQK